MIKTLKITSFIMAGLAGVFVLLPVVFGVRSDEDLEQFLDSPGAVENFKKARGDRDQRDESQTSPLVSQAEKFALFLNPPPPKTTAAPKTGKPSTPTRTVAPSSKFKLIGTSVYLLHPELSLALIDQPGKGLRWVRQGSKVGHSVIEQVKDGAVLLKDPRGTSELVVARKGRKSLVKGISLLSTGPPTALPPPAKAAAAATKPGAARHRVIDVDAEKEAELMALFVAELKAMQADPQQAGVEKAELDAFIAQLQSIQVTNQEAEKLDDLGKELQKSRQDPNQAKIRKVQDPGKRRRVKR